MPDHQRKIETMLFNYDTTYRTTFRCAEIRDQNPTKYQPKSTCQRVRGRPLKDIHTLSDWKTAAIPFNLLHSPKDFIQTSPSMLQKPYERPLDTGREEAIKTRPRLVMTPAVSMDDIENPQVRSLLIANIYTTSTARARQGAASTYFSVKAPLPDLPASANPIELPKLQPPLVPSEWRMNSVSWDGKQLRSFCDSMKEFWLQKQKSRCLSCNETAVVAAHRKMEHQMKTKRR